MFGLVLLSVTLIVTLTSLAVAQVGQSYTAGEQNLVQGMAVSLSLEHADGRQRVEALTPDNKQRFVGIITTKEANLFMTLNFGDDVFVTTRGVATALVSDLNGRVQKGDALTASPIKGVLVRADPREGGLIGYAVADFDAERARTQTVVDVEGASHEVKISPVAAEINPRGAPERQPGEFLSLIGESVIGRPVSQLQVLAAMVLLFVLLTVEGSIVYGAITSTIQAAGRNPLAKKSIHRQTYQALGAALVILLFGLGGIYLILWL